MKTQKQKTDKLPILKKKKLLGQDFIDLANKIRESENWEKEFDKRFVIRTGTARTKRVGYYVTQDPMSHVGHDPKLIKDFIRQAIAQAVAEERKRITKGIEVAYPPTFIEQKEYGKGVMAHGKQEATHRRRLDSNETNMLSDILHIINDHD